MVAAVAQLGPTQFYHPGTNQCVDIAKPESTPEKQKGAIFKRIARKAGYEEVSGNTWKKLPWLAKFKYFSSASRNMHSTARAYYESGHFVTASILRETARELHSADKNQSGTSERQVLTKGEVEKAEKNVFGKFKELSGIQNNLKRQDYVTHRTHMLESGGKTIETHANGTANQAEGTPDSETSKLLPKREPTEQTQGNRFSRIATKLARFAMSMCELTSAPTGFTYKVLRNTVFHGVTEPSQLNKGGTVVASFAIGMAAAFIVKTLRATLGGGEASGYGFNPIQMLTGVLVAFAAVSGISGGISWLAGLASQAAMKNIDPSDNQRNFIQYEMNSTLNKINELLISYKNSPGKMRMLNRAMEKKFPIKEGTIATKITVGKEQEIAVHPLLGTLYNALTAQETTEQITAEINKATAENPKQTKDDEQKLAKQITTKAQLSIAKQVLGEYLAAGSIVQESDINSRHKQIERQREKEFATLAGFVEHFEVSDSEKTPAHTVSVDENNHPIEHPKETHSRKADRIDGRQFTEEFAQQINRTLLTALATPTRLLDWAFKTNTASTIKRYADEKYSTNRANSLKAPEKTHLHKYHAEYISTHLHQYGPITRALMKASNFIHEVNYNYLLAVNAQTSRLFNKAAQAIQEKVLGQHSSKIACSALGRFLGGMTVTLVSFFGISALAAVTGGGATANGFQNSIALGSAKMSWLVTGTLMTVVGLPAFALGLLAKAAAAAEGWKGDIDAPVTQEMKRKEAKSRNSDNPYLVYI